MNRVNKCKTVPDTVASTYLLLDSKLLKSTYPVCVKRQSVTDGIYYRIAGLVFETIVQGATCEA
jgi:hypothetical protein